MRPPLLIGSLSEEAVASLEARYHQTQDADERTRCQIILLSYQGLTPPAIAKIVRWRARSVGRVIRRYQAHGVAALGDGRRHNPGRKRTITAEWEARLLEIVEQDPRTLGVNRATWTAPLLADYLAQETDIHIGEERVRHYLYLHDYALLRPTWTVAHKAREDPEYDAKKGR